MCVIAYKPAGVRPPSEDILMNCFTANPDGAGIAVIRPTADAVDIYKGFMSFDRFMEFAETVVTEDDIVGYHFRITTAGGTSPENCHPFPVSTHVKDLKALSFHTRFALLHNGIIGQGDFKLKLSDTQLYIKNTLAPRRMQSIASESGRISLETKGSRVLLMDGRTHETAMLGDGWIQDKDGCSYSNGSFRDDYLLRYRYSKSKTGAVDEYLFADGEMLCPLCGGFAEAISYNHDLLECYDCGTLMNSMGETIHIVTEGGYEEQ